MPNQNDYVNQDPRLDLRCIAEAHHVWCRELTEPYTPDQQATLQWIFDNAPMKQRKYVIINDKPVLCGTNKVNYRKDHIEGWIQVNNLGGKITPKA